MSRTPGILVAAVVVVALFPDQVSSAVQWLADRVEVPEVSAPPRPGPGGSAAKAAGLEALSRVKVIERRPQRPGYSRAQFGAAWTDNHDGLRGHNGCDTRNDMLRSALVDSTAKAGTRGCVILSGTLPREPYTGKTNVAWTKANAPALQVDHVFALSLAWDLGADQWAAAKRINFANDQALNLDLVDGKANKSKGDKPPSVWMPSSRGYACTYASKFAVVAAKYDLPLPEADVDSLRLTLTEAC